MKLSLRLLTIASMVVEGYQIADIGSDHGLLPIYLAKNHLSDNIYASDNKKGPYLRLKENVLANNLSSTITCALKDGLADLPINYNFVIISGMGGDLILSILFKDVERLNNIEYLLLSPHSHEKLIREELIKHGFTLISEKIVFEGHFYEILLFKKGQSQELTEEEYSFGPYLLKEKSDVFKRKYQEKINLIDKLLLHPKLSEERKEELLNEKKRYSSVL